MVRPSVGAPSLENRSSRNPTWGAHGGTPSSDRWVMPSFWLTGAGSLAWEYETNWRRDSSRWQEALIRSG